MQGLTIAITGASGYVGWHLAVALKRDGHNVIAYARRRVPGCTVVSNYLTGTLYDNADVVIHCAGLAHQHANPAKFYTANAELPVALGRKLADLPKPPRLIFFSSIAAREIERRITSVHDEEIARRRNAYALSKLMAERGLAKVSGVGVTCVRPPMVYGPHCPGNLPKLFRAIKRCVPLPLGFATAPRHYIYIENLVDAVRHMLAHPDNTFIHEIADEQPISTRDLCKRLAGEIGRTAILLPVPRFLAKFMLKLAGRRKVYSGLFKELIVRNTLQGWRPRYSVHEGIREFAATTAENGRKAG
ncbi:MAG: NAD-dependent epimerase/dehydratase family protein [Bdellovibrionales bacterium]